MNVHSVKESSVATAATTQTVGGDKREAVMQAALALFAAQGFHGTSMPDVAAKAHVGAGTIYRYFESKEALVNALFQQWKSELTRQLLDELPTGQSLREVFHRIWTRLAGFAQSHPEAFAFLELHHHQPYLDAESQRVESMLLEALCSFVEAGSAAGDFKPLPAAVLISLGYGAMSGLLKAAWFGYLTLTPKVIEQAGDCVWEAIAR
jgi:TetR/AcrR family transcriptional regulator, repressor of fatR-cypB operon